MDKLSKYRTLIKQLLTNHAEIINSHPQSNVETELSFDEDRDHYMLLKVGWGPQGRIRGATLYVRLRNNKFWIEEDWTEDGLATDLLEAGIPNDDIVVALDPPDIRPHTEFGAA